MEILTYLRVLRRWWLLLLSTVVVAVAVAYLSAPDAKLYAASATLVVGPRDVSDNLGLVNLTATYAALIDSEVIAEEAVRQTEVPRSPAGVVGATTATPVPATQVLRVTVVDPDPVVAQKLATAMANVFVNSLRFTPQDGRSSFGPSVSTPVTLYQPAALPVAPQPVSRRARVATAAIFGLMAAVAAVLLLEYLDQSVRSVEDAERRFDLPVLGAVPMLASPGSAHATAPAARGGGKGDDLAAWAPGDGGG
jgi:capsular polysaccharide biosynthesis protein